MDVATDRVPRRKDTRGPPPPAECGSGAAEQEASRREERFRSLLENAWSWIHEVGSDGRIGYSSASVQTMLGYAATELRGRRLLDLVHPEEAQEVVRTLDDAFRSPGRAHRLATRLRHRDGEWRHVEAQMKTVWRGAGEAVAIVNTRDVTDSKRIEQALRESEERYRLVARATHSAIREWHVRSGRCSWTGSSHVLLRYKGEEIGSTVDWWYGRIHPDDRERVINSIQALLDGVGESWSDEYRILRGDGAYATVLDCCHIARSERGIPIRVVGSLVDVTERRRNEEAQRFLAKASTLLGEKLDLQKTLASLARLTLPTLADYCLIDLVEEDAERGGQGALRRVAQAHVDPTRELLLRKEEAHPLEGDADRHPMVRAVRSRVSVLERECTPEVLESIAHDEEHRAGLSEIGLCSFMIIPLVAHEKTLGVITLASAESGRRYGQRDVLVAEDLAHRAALAIEHAQLYDEAQEAIRAREDVLGVVSHDLRNPLNIIQLSAGLMLSSAEERRSENVQSLKRIGRAAQQMNGMIEDLLDMSRIEAGRFSVARAEQRVRDLVREACDLLEPLCGEKRIELRSEVEEGLGEVSIDAGQILRVFSNLVGNAIKFTPEGGSITVRAAAAGELVDFSVSDTGPGIPPEQLPHVFDRYWQAREGDRRGAGLGLAIAMGIVEAHGGRIWVESGEGEGATFHFSIPAAERDGGENAVACGEEQGERA